MSIRCATARVCFFLMLTCGYAGGTFAENPKSKTVEEPEAEAKEQAEPALIIDYSSVFDDYVPFDDIPDIGWKEANDNVGEIGGWRAYAKLVQEEAKKAAELESKEKGDDK